MFSEVPVLASPEVPDSIASKGVSNVLTSTTEDINIPFTEDATIVSTEVVHNPSKDRRYNLSDIDYIV